MITYWPAPAKINLFLYITGQRADGYHTLQTLVHFLDYYDIISIKQRYDGKIFLLSSIAGVPNEKNIIIRAAKLLMSRAKQTAKFNNCNGADIAIKYKRLPIGGGLGAGSSNAATVLVALNLLWKCGLSENELVNIGLCLGADVPFFVRGYSAFVEGIGDILYPIELPIKWYLIAYPNIIIPTSLIFNDPNLPRNTEKRSIDHLFKCKFKNDCEVIAKKIKKIDFTLSWLLKYAPARITGTGSCVYSEFDTELAAYNVLKLAPKWIHCFVAKGINISPLKQVITNFSEFK